MHSRRVWLAVCRNPATLWPVLRAWVNEAHRTQYVFSFGMIVCRLLNKFGKQCIQAEGAARRNAEPREPIGPPPRSPPHRTNHHQALQAHSAPTVHRHPSAVFGTWSALDRRLQPV